jgi:hypothetical protein
MFSPFFIVSGRCGATARLLRKLNSDFTPAAITEKKCERGKFQMNAENSPHKPEENQRPVRPMNVKGIRSLRV